MSTPRRKARCRVGWFCKWCNEPHTCAHDKGHRGPHSNRHDTAYPCTWDGQLAMRFPSP